MLDGFGVSHVSRDSKDVALADVTNIEVRLDGAFCWFVAAEDLAEFERNLIRERTQAGLAAARARGRKGGRPKSLDTKKRKMAVKLYREGNHGKSLRRRDGRGLCTSVRVTAWFLERTNLLRPDRPQQFRP